MPTLHIRYNTASLVSLIMDQIGNDSAPTLIHAGHFPLSATLGSAIDMLEEEHVPIPAIREMLHLSRMTWQAACEIVSLLPVGNCKLMTLVNDWQFLEFGSGSKREQARQASRARDAYYRANPQLPLHFLRAIEAYRLSPDIVFKRSPDQWLFSESALRSRLSSTVSRIMRDPQRAESLGLARYFTESGAPVIQAVNADGAAFCLLYCGSTNCAGEFLQLLGDLHERGVRRFVNLYPMQCKHPVLIGTSLAHQLFSLSGMEIINVALALDLQEISIDRYSD